MSLARRLTYKPAQYIPVTNIALVQTDQDANSTAGASFDYVLPSLTIGNFFLLYVVAPQINAPSWTLAGTNQGNYIQYENNRSASSARLAQWGKFVESGDSGATITVSNGAASSGYAVILREYSGVNSISPLDVTSTFANTGSQVTSFTGPSITTASDKDMLVGVWFQPLANGTTSSTWTQLDLTNEITQVSQVPSGVNNGNLFTGDLLVDGPNTYGGYTASVNTSRATGALLTALKPA